MSDITIDDLIGKIAAGKLPPDDYFDRLTDDQVKALAARVIELRDGAMREEQIVYYQPVSENAKRIHYSTAKQLLVRGGNRSSKSDTVLADAVIRMTGIIPYSLPDYPKEKIQCPMNVRLTCASLTNTWETVLKPKLLYSQWNGKGEPGTSRGHYGWIPRRFLKKGRWEESWSAQNRVLTLTCGCTLQVMAYNQEVSEFYGASKHLCLHDEGPPWDIYRENRMRLLDTGGQSIIAFTPPDDESRSWSAAWIYDELVVPGETGGDPDIEVIQLFTEQNRILDQKDIAEVQKGLTPIQKQVRLEGSFMHLSGRIYPMYTDRPKAWCFYCNTNTLLVEDGGSRIEDGKKKEVCASCHFDRVCEYTNLTEPQPSFLTYPIVFLIDPHPRKANFCAWIAMDPIDDAILIYSMEADNEPKDLANKVFEYERSHHLYIATRLIDPNMGPSPAHNAGRRGESVQDSFDAVGLRCRPADDNLHNGISKLRELFKPDERTKIPRLRISTEAKLVNRQLLRYVWDEWSARSLDNKDPKAVPRNKDDDYPTLLRYFAMEQFSFKGLTHGNVARRATPRRKTGYGYEARTS